MLATRATIRATATCVLLAAAACARQNYGGPPPIEESRARPQPSVTALPLPTASASSAPAPSGGSSCASGGSGRIFAVGDGQVHASLSTVPWATLAPGDTVRIHARREPYREKVLVSQSGTELEPIRICGVPGPSGELPVIDGDGAVADRSLDYAGPAHEARSLVIVSPRGQQLGDYKPRYVVIEGLELRGASESHSFTDRRGQKRPYAELAAALFIERGEHIVVRGCTIHDSGNGLFVASGGDESMQSRDILVEGNHIYGNGTIGARGQYHHDVYTEAIGITFQYNRIGPPRDGSGGNALKDRSAGTIVRYNDIEGGAHILDLVEPEGSAPIAGADRRLRETYVYGNLLIAGKHGARPIHYGGDTGTEASYRKGTLFFYHNTVVLPASERETFTTTIFGLETDDESADVRNNLFVMTGTTHVTWAGARGKVRLGVNFANKPIAGRRADGAVAAPDGADNKLVVAADPKFAGPDFCLAADSPARGVGGELPATLAGDLLPRLQYKKDQSFAPRERFGKGGDLGAFVCP